MFFQVPVNLFFIVMTTCQELGHVLLLLNTCPSFWPVVITMKNKLTGTRKKIIGYWPVLINGNKFATGQILKKPV